MPAHFLRFLSGTKPKYTDLIQPMCRKCAKTYYVKYAKGRLVFFVLSVLMSITFLLAPTSTGKISVRGILIAVFPMLWFMILTLNDFIIYRYGQKMRNDEMRNESAIKED